MSLVSSDLALAEAEQLVADLKAQRDSPAQQATVLQRVDKLRCLLQTGLDSLLFHARPVCSPQTVYMCICYKIV